MNRLNTAVEHKKRTKCLLRYVQTREKQRIIWWKTDVKSNKTLRQNDNVSRHTTSIIVAYIVGWRARQRLGIETVTSAGYCVVSVDWQLLVLIFKFSVIHKACCSLTLYTIKTSLNWFKTLLLFYNLIRFLLTAFNISFCCTNGRIFIPNRASIFLKFWTVLNNPEQCL